MSVIWKHWRPEAVKKQVLAELSENAEIVGMFVETEARRRLDAIKKPSNDRAVAYRRFLSRWVLTHTIKTTERSVEIRVGMRRRSEKGGGHHGYYIETGSKTAAAQPYLRPAVFHNAREIVRLLAGK